MSKLQKYFDPETLARIRPLGLRAKTLVEGLVAGQHRSPLRGHSIEFAQHREYVPGDDTRQIDWKVYARSDRYYLKQYEDETNLRCFLLLDQSESMSYRGEHSPLSKREYAELLVCAVAYLVVSQQDSVGLATFSEKIHEWLPAEGSPSQLDELIRILESASNYGSTNVAASLKEVAMRLQQPSLVILLSDALDDVKELTHACKLLRHAGHDFIMMHVLDRDEVEFPFDQMTEFAGLERLPSLTADPMLIGGAYRAAMREMQRTLRFCCEQLECEYYSIKTDEPLIQVLPTMLASRNMRGR